MPSDVSQPVHTPEADSPKLVVESTPKDTSENSGLQFPPNTTSFGSQGFRSSVNASQQLPVHCINRRHSFNPNGRKPLRSSPLAGPALLSNGSILETDEANNAHKPSRIPSTPELVSPTPPPPVRFQRPKTAHGCTTVPFQLNNQRLLSSTSDLGIERTKGKKQQIEIPSGVCPPILNWDIQHDGMIDRSKDILLLKPNFNRRPKTAHGYPKATIASAGIDSSLPASSSDSDSNKSWLLANTYEVTPRFTRLGLASSNVVLPVSARDHKRRPHSSHGTGSLISSISSITLNNNPASPAHSSPSSSPGSSLPSLSLTRSSSSSSHHSSCDTVPTTSSTTSTAVALPSLQVSSEKDLDTQESHAHFSLSVIRKRSLARMKSFRLKKPKSHNDMNAEHTPIPTIILDKSSDSIPALAEQAVPVSQTVDTPKGNEKDITISIPIPDMTPSEVKKDRRKGPLKKFWKKLSVDLWKLAM